MIVRALAYFGLVFALGFVLGTGRVLWLVPRLGERTAELCEMPIMLLGIVLAARFVARRWPPSSAPEALGSGLLALAVLLGVELGVVLALRGITLREYLATRDPVSGTVYALSLVFFALMPWIAARRALRR